MESSGGRRSISRMERDRQMMLAYLDPVSWFAALQIGGVGFAWAAARARRLFPAAFRQRPISAGSVHLVGSLVAVAELIGAPVRPRLVVVIEGPRDWPYVGPAVGALGDVQGRDIWVVSRGDLPIESLELLPFPVRAVADLGLVSWITLTTGLQSDGAITTITDLDTTAFVKSPFTRYIYLFHSLMSTHVSYLAGAFDAYDLLLCPSGVHVQELHFRDKRLGRPERRAIEVGYPVLQSLSARFQKSPPSRHVVIAPSWSSDHLFQSTWTSAADALLAAGWQVSIRPHPETLKRSPGVIAALVSRYAACAAVRIDLSAEQGGALDNLDALVTDWSGTGTEVALAGRPVVFVDTPQKIRNPDWLVDGTQSIEATARAVLVVIVDPARVGTIPEILKNWQQPEAAVSLREQIVSTIPNPASVAAGEISRFIGWTS